MASNLTSPPSQRLQHLWPVQDQIELIKRQGISLRQRNESRVNLADYRFDPCGYIRTELGWEPWAGTAEQPGQAEVLDAYALALRQQFERNAYQNGDLSVEQLRYWKSGDTIQNYIRVEAGHTVGKTKIAAGMVNHFFDCFVPSIIYTYAPTQTQIHDLLWKEIKSDRIDRDLPGRVLDLELNNGPDHFAKGRATNSAGGTGTHRVHGQHGQYLMFVVDEAEGVDDFLWDAIDSMTSGGIAIVLMLANPQTRTSRFHRIASRSNVFSLRISCIWHPNVIEGREVVPHAVRREYIDIMIEDHCEIVGEHNSDEHTFEVPWLQGQIFKPDGEFMFRVLGIAPLNVTDNTLVPIGRYDAACKREPLVEHPNVARMGIDVARYGKDYGALYIRHNGRAWRAARLYHQDTFEYARVVMEEARKLAEQEVTSLHVRIDGGGGFGGGVIDHLTHDLEFAGLFPACKVLEVHFNGTPYAYESYADLATEMYAEAADALSRLAVLDAPAELEADLCERTYRWMSRQGIAVKKLEPKDDFKKRVGRSPDDGDGFVLAVAPDYVFEPIDDHLLVYDEPVVISPY